MRIPGLTKVEEGEAIVSTAALPSEEVWGGAVVETSKGSLPSVVEVEISWADDIVNAIECTSIQMRKTSRQWRRIKKEIEK